MIKLTIRFNKEGDTRTHPYIERERESNSAQMCAQKTLLRLAKLLIEVLLSLDSMCVFWALSVDFR